MIATLALGALLLTGAHHDTVARRPPPRAKPAPKPPPPPPPADAPDEDKDEPDEAPLQQQPPPPDAKDPLETLKPSSDDLSDEQVGYAVLGGTCCCLVFAGALGLVIYLIVRKKPATTAASPAAAPFTTAAAPTTPAPFHLSVLAVGIQTLAREAVAQQLPLNEPGTAGERTQLVRDLSKALLSQAGAWTHFGYGERVDLFDEASAARSYQLAVDDFKKRSELGSMSGEAAVVVATLVLCTRRQLRGVSSLEDREQIQQLLGDRSGLLESELMGAFVVWSPPLGASEVVARFPEMHALR